MFKVAVFALFVAVVVADVRFLPQVQRTSIPHPEVFRILKQDQELDPSGNYRWSYETENGIAAQEQGSQRQITSQDSGTVAQGSYSYTSPEGIPVFITYVADENGFQAQGDAIPTPPPIPAAIARSLEYIRNNPQQQQQQRRF